MASLNQLLVLHNYLKRFCLAEFFQWIYEYSMQSLREKNVKQFVSGE